MCIKAENKQRVMGGILYKSYLNLGYLYYNSQNLNALVFKSLQVEGTGGTISHVSGHLHIYIQIAFVEIYTKRFCSMISPKAI